MNPGAKKAVFFDAAGTLFYPFPSVGEIYADFARKYGMTVKALDVGKAFKCEFEHREGLRSLEDSGGEEQEKAWWRELVISVISQISPLRDFEAFFEELYSYFATEKAWRFYPDTLITLHRLKSKNVIMGVISNWDSRLYSVCSSMGLNDFFSFILPSSSVGFAKPSQKIFQMALKCAGVNAFEALHVGDNLENDYAGGLAAGIDALLIDREGNTEHDASVSVIRSLTEIISFTG